MDAARLMTGVAQSVPAWDAKPGRREATGDLNARAEERVAQPVLKLEVRPEPSANAETIESLREAINKSARNRLQIDRAEDNGRFIYRILDPDTGETMRQWPPEKYLELIEYLNDKRGGLVDKTV